MFPIKNLLRGNPHWNWAIFDQAVVSGTNFVVGILLVRYLGIEQYGIFILIWMLVQFFSSIQSAVIVAPMLSLAPKIIKENLEEYYSATFVLQGLLVTIIVAVALAATIFNPQDGIKWLESKAVLPMLVCLVSVQLQDYMRRIFFSQGKPRLAFFIDLISYAGQIPLVLIFVRQWPLYENVLIITAGCMLLGFCVGWQSMGISRVSVDAVRHVATRHWRSAKWLMGSAVLQWMSGNYFIIAAGTLLGPAVVGAIRAAQNILGLTHVVFQGLENVVPGEASQRYKEGDAVELRRYLTTVAIYLVIFTGCVAAVAVLLAEPLLNLVYGHADNASVSAMFWYGPLYILVATALPLRVALRTLEQTRAIFIAYVIGSIFSLATAGFMITNFSLNGVMAGLLIVQAIGVSVLASSLFLKPRSQ